MALSILCTRGRRDGQLATMRLLGIGAVGGGVVGGVLAIIMACGPTVEADHRHLAEEYCREWIDFVARCSTSPWSEELRQRERDECEADEAWDWTDWCGDRKWEWRECRLDSIPCEEWPEVQSDPYDDYCAEEKDAFLRKCLYTEDHGG